MTQITGKGLNICEVDCINCECYTDKELSCGYMVDEVAKLKITNDKHY